MTVFVDVEVVSLPLLQDAAEHEENLEKIYLCKAISLNIRGQMYNSCVRGMMLYYQNVGPSDKKKRWLRNELLIRHHQR